MHDRLAGTLSLARRAGKLVMGFDPVKAGLGRDIKLVLFASDLSEGSRRRMQRLCDREDIPTASLPLTLDEIWYYVGKRIGIMALADEGFAKKALTLIGETT